MHLGSRYTRGVYGVAYIDANCGVFAKNHTKKHHANANATETVSVSTVEVGYCDDPLHHRYMLHAPHTFGAPVRCGYAPYLGHTTHCHMGHKNYTKWASKHTLFDG